MNCWFDQKMDPSPPLLTWRTQPPHFVNNNQEKQRTIQRYQSDYSRWEDWSPDDPATKEEAEEREKEQDRIQNEAFEKANADFCNQVLFHITEDRQYWLQRHVCNTMQSIHPWAHRPCVHRIFRHRVVIVSLKRIWHNVRR